MDAATWALVNASTRKLAEQTAEALRIRGIAQQVAQRYRNTGLPQRAGHLFEVMHEASFNRDAIAQGSTVRAPTTEWAVGGSQNAAADLHVVDGGRLLAAAQAKVMGRATTTARSIASDRYEGMQRLIAQDQLAAVEDLLDRRLTLDAEGIGYADYVDARAHVTDALHAGDVRSRPVSTEEAYRAAADPVRWGNRQAAAAASREVGAAVAAGAATGAALAGLVEAAGHAARVRAGETSAAAAAASAAGAAARAAVRSGAVAGVGKSIGIAAKAGTLPAALGRGSSPASTAEAVVEVTEAGIAFARGDIDSGELAARCCEAALRATLTGVCGAVAQTVIPVPVVGALAGGLVAQAAATLITQGLRTALAAARTERLDDERMQVLDDEAATAVATALLLGQAECALGEQRNAYVTSTVSPLLDDALIAVTSAGPDEALKRLSEVTRCFSGRPLFVTVEEFDAWMADPLASLTMDPNWR
ncbi:hypothetical protein [Kineococcus auxinigenes]|uniref:hypothetical protein n=1 Tax=unclassified Kineococcus TaxID=2621656 RepID=UPI003D7D9A2C